MILALNETRRRPTRATLIVAIIVLAARLSPLTPSLVIGTASVQE